MSVVGDHLSDDGHHGMYGPAPDEIVAEAMRLANLMATARVRRYVFRQGLSQLETEAGVDRRVNNATKALRDYLEGIVR